MVTKVNSDRKKRKRIKKFKETADWRYTYQNKLHKACFQYDIAYGDFKDLTIRTASEKIFHDKAFNISKNSRQDGYQYGFSSMVYKFFE